MMKNENGYTLILSLLAILLIFAFSTVLISGILNSRLQFNNSEHIIQQRDVAEMGIIHYATMIENKIKEINERGFAYNPEISQEENQRNYQRDFCGQLFTNDILSVSKSINHHASYVVTMENENNPETKCINQDHFEIYINSASTIDGDSHYTLNGNIAITLNIDNDGSDEGNEDDDLDWINEVLNHDGFKEENQSIVESGKNTLTFPTNTYFKGSITMSGTNKLTISGSAFFDNSITLSGNDDIFISGHAYFDQSVTLSGNSLIDIETNAYFNTDLKFSGNNTIRIGNNAYFAGNIILSGSADLIVFGDAYFENRIDSNEKNICVKGNAFYKESNGEFSLYDNFPNKCTSNGNDNPPNQGLVQFKPEATIEVNYNKPNH